MRKSLKKITTLVMAATLALSVVPATTTSAAVKGNLIKGEWSSYFGASEGWFEGSDGELTQNETSQWFADIQSIGWGGVWGAQVKAEDLKYTKGMTYTVKCTLESSTIDKWVLIKVEGEDPNAFNPAKTDNAPLAFKWVQLKAGKSQDVSFDFTLTKNYSGHLALFFGIGGELGDRDDEKEDGLYEGLTVLPTDGDATYATSIKASNISITPVATTIKKVAVKKGAAQVTVNKNTSAKKYIIKYSTKKNLGGAKKVTTSKAKATIKGLTSGKKYYFAVAIVNKNGKTSTIWSASKSAKIK